MQLRAQAVLILLMLALVGPAYAQQSRVTAFVERGSFLGGVGVNVHFGSSHRAEVERIAALGFRVVRADLLWAKVERVRGQYNWGESDQLVADLRRSHITPLLILAYSNPLYAKRVPGRPATDSMAYAAPLQGGARSAFIAFARAAALRYGRGIVWEVWNEPDHNFGTPVNLNAYIDFAQDVCHEVRKVDHDATIVGPAASGFLWWFLNAFVEADGDHCFDSVSVHPYRDEAPESVLRDWQEARSFLPECKPERLCKDLVDSEWGYSVTSQYWSAERQADFVVRLRLLDLMSDIPLTILYDWRNDGTDPADKEANFGLNDFHGTPKPVLGALEKVGTALAGTRYMGRVKSGSPADFLLIFGRDGKAQRVVAWTTSPRHTEVVLQGPVCLGGPSDEGASQAAAPCGPAGSALEMNGTVQLSGSPRVLPVVAAAGGALHVQAGRTTVSD